MCHYTGVSWEGAPRWVKGYMMAQLGMIILHVLFWCTVFACAFLNDKPVPHVVSQTVSALFTPIFDHVLPHLKQMQEYSVEALKASQQRRFTFEREQQEREILLQAHRHCVSFCNEPSAIDPELRFVCRTLLLKLFPNITKTIQADSEPLSESEL